MDSGAILVLALMYGLDPIQADRIAIVMGTMPFRDLPSVFLDDFRRAAAVAGIELPVVPNG